MQPAFEHGYVTYDSASISPTSTDTMYLARPDTGYAPQKRKDAPNPAGRKPVKKVKRVGPRSDSKTDVNTAGDADKDGDTSSKPKRVRTGCLTCRERHLKCDEGTPDCNNCKKSNRTCKRGVRLNFIDYWVERPPRLCTLYGTRDWNVTFLDESREIASEYQGGLQRYRPLVNDDDNTAGAPPPPTMPVTMPDLGLSYDFHAPAVQQPGGGMMQPLPSIQYPDHTQAANMEAYGQQSRPESAQFQPPTLPHSGSTQHSHDSAPSLGRNSVASYHTLDTDLLNQDNEKKEVLDSQDETLFMQVFVEEVGLWMDSMDPHKHFSRLLPFRSLDEPMLLNAFLACGARHLTLVNPAYSEEKALHHYDTATRFLLKNLQNPNRDTVICATTAVILNVYEIMSERALQRMNHIAGARALIKECGWNARAQGIGAACFWLNVGLEVLSCLHFNWQVAWNPDDWGVDMDFERELRTGKEETWTHRMLYIIAKICNFRATSPRCADPDSRDHQILLHQRHAQWLRLKSMCEAWDRAIPRTMQPMAYLYPFQTSSKSAFPEIWLVKRSTIVARLFYHTAMLLLAQTNPYYSPKDNQDMADLQTHHSQMICGIAAHVKDRGVASVAIRSLAHAAEVLTDRKEQDEVIQIFHRINKETGWRIGFVYKDLMEKWGWSEEPSAVQHAQTHTAAREALEASRQQQPAQMTPRHSMQLQQGFDYGPNTSAHSMSPVGQSSLRASPSQASMRQQQQQQPQPQPQQAAKTPTSNGKPRIPSGIPNPMYAKADFSLPQHPYQNFYVAPTNGYTNSQSNGQLFYTM